MNPLRRLREFAEPLVMISSTHPKRWCFILSGLCIGWIIATSFTALGLYMVACRSYKTAQGDSCKFRSLQGEEHLILALGAILNVGLLLLMLALLLNEKIGQYYRQDPPPDYESLIKAETPPPTYEELGDGNLTVSANEGSSDSLPLPSLDTEVCSFQHPNPKPPSSPRQNISFSESYNPTFELPPPPYLSVVDPTMEIFNDRDTERLILSPPPEFSAVA